jgi:glutathione S-transferase
VKLHWSPRSPFVRKVMVCAHELGVAGRIEKIYTLVSASNVNAEMLRVNPIGRIPTLVADDGTVLYDSVVICEYLDTLCGGSRLFPKEGPARWDTLRRHALANGMLEILVLWRGGLGQMVTQQSPDVLAAFEGKTLSALGAAEQEAPAIDGPRIDIATITLGVALAYLDFRFAQIDWRARHPRLARWFETFAARPSMQQTAPRDELEQAGG